MKQKVYIIKLNQILDAIDAVSNDCYGGMPWVNSNQESIKQDVKDAYVGENPIHISNIACSIKDYETGIMVGGANSGIGATLRIINKVRSVL